MSMEELSTKSSEELKAMLTSREAWHALAEVQTAAASGPDVEREVLLHQAHALQTWPSAESPVIGIFCGDDLVPRITENNIRYLLHTLQHSEPEWKQPIFGFFQDICSSSSWNELLEHYKISNDDHSVKKLTRTLELKFRSKVWWHIHKQTIKSREQQPLLPTERAPMIPAAPLCFLAMSHPSRSPTSILYLQAYCFT